MPKRQHDTDIWEEDWFIQMDMCHREFWFYLKDQCDHAGIWRPNLVNFQRVFKTEINVKAFLEQVNAGKERVVIMPNGRWFLTGFMHFQYGNLLNPKNQAHKGAIKRVLDYKVPIDLINGILNKEVFDYKLVDRIKSTLLQQDDIEENNQSIDYQQQKEEAPSKGLPSPYEGLKDKDKDIVIVTSIVKENISLEKNGKNENLPEIFEITEKHVPLPFSTPNFQMPTVAFMHDGTPLANEIQEFLSKSNFQHFAMMNRLTSQKLGEEVTQFVQHVLSKQDFEKANKMPGWLASWYRKKALNQKMGGGYQKQPEILSTEKRDYSNIKSWRSK